MKYLVSILVFGALVASAQFGFSTQAPLWQKKIGSSLRTLSYEQQVAMDVIVILNDQANLAPAQQFRSKLSKANFVVHSLRDVAAASQASLISYLTAKNLKFKSFYIMNAISVRGVSPALIEEIARRTEVRTIIADPIVTNKDLLVRSGSRTSDPQGVGANITSTGAETVWAKGVKGEGIVVAGQDTGVDWTHPALVKQYRGSAGTTVDHTYSWHDSIREPLAQNLTNKCGYATQAPCDDNDHGTHTVGTMIGFDGGANAIGMAPEAQWIACRNMDAGNGRPSTYIECYEWFLAPYPAGGSSKDGDPAMAPHVINNSWGCPLSEGCQGSEIKPVMEAIYHAGIMNVVSAGNSGPGCSTIMDQPASVSDFGFSVGAHNHRSGAIASFSSRGPSTLDGQVGPDITAPGVSVRSSIPGGSYAEFMWSGTSMAGPHVAGAVALLWSAQPKLVGDVDRTIEILRSTATPATTTENCGGIAGTTVPNNTFGYGRLNIDAAVKKATSAL